MLVLLLSTIAWGAPVVDPVVNPSVSRLRLTSLVDVRATRVEQADCQGEACEAWDQRTVYGAEGQIALLRGLGLAVGLGYQRARVDEADFDATGLALSAALRGALPIASSWWVHAQGRVDSSSPGNQGPEAGKSSLLAATATLGLAVGDLDSGFIGHFGAQAAPLYAFRVQPLGEQSIELELSPSRPVGLAGGFSFLSQPMGGSWSAAPRLAVHVDATAIHSSSVSAGIGVAW